MRSRRLQVQGVFRGQRGFTLIELLLLLVTLSLLAALARPILHRSLLDNRAREIREDLSVIREAVLTYRVQYQAWPPESARGRIPSGLEDFLPEGFTFRHPDYVLDYDNWSGMGAGFLEVAVEYSTVDQKVGRVVMGMLGSKVWTDGHGKYAWILEE